MFNKQYLNREYILVAATVILLMACYQLAFKKTITAWQINEQLKAQLAQSADVSTQPGYIQRKNANLDRTLDLYKADTINFRSNTISTISSVAERENVKVSAVPSNDPFYHTPQFVVQRLSLEGAYFDLVKTLNDLQSGTSMGVIRSVLIRSSASNASSASPKVIMEISFQVLCVSMKSE
jgi:hypothetical protein